MNKILIKEKLNLNSKIFIVLAITCAWCSTYYLNEWLFSQFTLIENFISWVFVPAAIRVIAVLLAVWLGVIGLFLGSAVTFMFASGYEPMSMNILVLAAISSVAPMMALLTCAKYLNIQNSLKGLSASNLFVFCAVCAMFSVLPFNVAYYYFGFSINILDGIGPMFIGDFLGMLIVLYIIRLTFPKLQKKPKKCLL
jgi:hypothetical protein